MVSLGLVVVCGLPGSGKTALCQRLCSQSSHNLRCVHIQYDALLPKDVEKQLIKDDDLPSRWKAYRRCILMLVEKYVCELNGDIAVNKPATSFTNVEGTSGPLASASPLPVESTCVAPPLLVESPCVDPLLSVESPHVDPSLLVTSCDGSASNSLTNSDVIPLSSVANWHHRWQCLSSCLGAGVLAELQHRFEALCDVHQSKSSEQLVLLLDDTMYYRSMRYEYYQLARQFTVGFGQLYVRCDNVQTLVERNRQRPPEQLVNDEVIVGMATKLEAPSGIGWEKQSWVVSSSTVADVDVIRHFLTDAVLVHAVEASAENDVDPEMQRRSRLAGAASILHQADRILRRLVAERVTTCMGGADERRCAAKGANAARTWVISRLREQELIEVSEDDVKEASSGNGTEGQLYVAVRTMFDKHLSTL